MEIVNEWFLTGKFRKFDTHFRTDYAFEKRLMAELPIKGHDLHKAEIEYDGKFGHKLGRIQHISLMKRIDIFNTTCRLATQNVAPTLTSFQGIKLCVKYLTSHTHKPIFYLSNYYDRSNVIRLTWSGNQVEYHTTHNCLECHQYADHAKIINIRRSISGIIHTLIVVDVCWKVQIQASISFDYTAIEIRCM